MCVASDCIADLFSVSQSPTILSIINSILLNYTIIFLISLTEIMKIIPSPVEHLAIICLIIT